MDWYSKECLESYRLLVGNSPFINLSPTLKAQRGHVLIMALIAYLMGLKLMKGEVSRT